jgi:hypothetical protein
MKRKMSIIDYRVSESRQVVSKMGIIHYFISESRQEVQMVPLPMSIFVLAAGP